MGKRRLPPVAQSGTALYIGEWISRLRLTQAFVAAKAEISEAYLSELISTRKINVGFNILVRIADAMGLKPLNLTRPPPPRESIDDVIGIDPAIIDRLKSRDN